MRRLAKGNCRCLGRSVEQLTRQRANDESERSMIRELVFIHELNVSVLVLKCLKIMVRAFKNRLVQLAAQSRPQLWCEWLNIPPVRHWHRLENDVLPASKVVTRHIS